jgi:hypothetical protein
MGIRAMCIASERSHMGGARVFAARARAGYRCSGASHRRDGLRRLYRCTLLILCVQFDFNLSTQTLEFELSVFLPFLQTAVARLVQIEQEADDNTTKRRIAKAINILIERAGQHVSITINEIDHKLTCSDCTNYGTRGTIRTSAL